MDMSIDNNILAIDLCEKGRRAVSMSDKSPSESFRDNTIRNRSKPARIEAEVLDSNWFSQMSPKHAS